MLSARGCAGGFCSAWGSAAARDCDATTSVGAAGAAGSAGCSIGEPASLLGVREMAGVPCSGASACGGTGALGTGTVASSSADVYRSWACSKAAASSSAWHVIAEHVAQKLTW